MKFILEIQMRALMTGRPGSALAKALRGVADDVEKHRVGEPSALGLQALVIRDIFGRQLGYWKLEDPEHPAVYEPTPEE